MKKYFLLAFLPFALTACGGDDKEGDDKGGDKKAAFNECECLKASLADRSDECHVWRAEMISAIKADLGTDDLDAIEAEMESLKADCE